MKTLMAVTLLGLLCAGRADGQTNIIIRTNQFLAPSIFREVEGQLYNTSSSQKWGCLIGIFELVERLPTGGFLRRIPGDPSLLDTIGCLGRDGRKVFHANLHTIILIRNHPLGAQATGILSERVMLVGTTNYAEQLVSIYDCGTAHYVTVLTTNKIATFK